MTKLNKEVLHSPFISLLNRKLRTALSPPFRYDIVKNWVDDFRELSLELMKIWETQMNDPVVDIIHWMPEFTLDALGKTTFSRDFNAMKGSKDKYFQAFSDIVTGFGSRKIIFSIIVRSHFIFHFDG
jgi:cytochrome P450